MISPSKAALAVTDSPVSLAQTDEAALTRAIQGLHQKLHRQSLAQAGRLLGLTLRKRCHRFIRLAWSTWTGGMFKWRAAKRSLVLEEQLATCRCELRDVIVNERQHRLRGLVQRPRLLALKAGFDTWRCYFLWTRADDSGRLEKREAAHKTRSTKERLEGVIRDHVDELFDLNLRFGRDKLCGVLHQRKKQK